MAAGFGLLRLSPATLWSMTPKELAAAIGGLLGPDVLHPPVRSELAALMRRFPDV